MTLVRVCFMLIASALCAALYPSAALAQVADVDVVPRRPDQPTAAPAPRSLHAFFLAGSASMTAADSFEAALGSPRLIDVGGGVELRNLIGRLFLRGAVSRAGGSGSRVHVVDGQTISTEIPLDVSLITTEVTAGWRFGPRTQPTVGYYIGGGIGLVAYRQSSPFEEEGDNVDEAGLGYALLFGFDKALGRSRRFTVGGEAQYRVGPTMSGSDISLFEAFGEDSLGGFTIRGVVGFRLK